MKTKVILNDAARTVYQEVDFASSHIPLRNVNPVSNAFSAYHNGQLNQDNQIIIDTGLTVEVPEGSCLVVVGNGTTRSTILGPGIRQVRLAAHPSALSAGVIIAHAYIAHCGAEWQVHIAEAGEPHE